MANSRLAARASFFAEVDVLSAADAMPQRLWGQDLSEAGIFLQTTKPYHPGDRLSLRFDVTGNEVHVRAAEVVWVRPFEPISVDGSLPGIGVRFLSVDPPARAAIRRYVQTMMTAQNDDVPTPPPHAELPEGSALESLRPLSLPPIGAISLPPFDSLPPASTLEEALAELPAESEDENLDGPTLPGEPPALAALVALDDTDTDTNTDTDSEDTEETPHHGEAEHPLAGWRFEIVREPVAEPKPKPAAQPTLELMPSPDAPTLKPRSLPPEATLSFEDSDRGSVAPSAGLSSPSLELSGPHASPRRLELSFEDERHERGPDVLALAAHAKVDQDFLDGKLAVLELPQAEERGHDAKRTKRLRIAWAAGLLLAGGALGVVVGYEPAPELASDTRTEDTRVTVLPAPKSVAEAEKELFAAAPPVEEPVRAQKAAKEEAPPPAVASTTKGAEPAEKAPPPSVPFVSPDEIATSAPGKLPRKETRPEELSLTSAAPAAAPGGAQMSAQSASESVTGVKVEFGRVTVPLSGGRVARSFGLANPSRVVVDLVDAELPKQRSEEVGEKGIARVRFGRPDPEHVRVVVELTGTEAPTGITTLKKGSSLSVAWR